jgi:hypothetical protein
MRILQFKNLNYTLWAHLLLWSVAIWSLFTRASWDVNPHHDGVILAPAIAVSEGKTPNLEVFSQYGFLIPYLQGAWMQITSNSLYDLRLFTVLQVVLTVYIFFVTARKYIGSSLASLFGCAWLVSFPHLLPFIPWPSVTSSLLTVTGIWIISNCNGQRNKSLKLLHISFIIFFLAALIRPQLFLALIPISFSVLKLSATSVRQLIKNLANLAIFPAAVICVTAYQGSFIPYLNQSIFWAGGKYLGIGFTVRGLIELALIPIIGALIYLGVLLGTRFHKNYLFASYWTLALILGITFLFFYSWTYKYWPYLAFKHPEVLFAALGWNWINAFSYFVFCWLSFNLLRNAKRYWDRPTFSMSYDSLILIIAGVTFLQLYPASDPLHFWWLIPTFLLGAIVSTDNLARIPNDIRYFYIPIIFFICICLVNFANDLNKDRITYKSTVLNGMIGLPAEVKYIDGSISMLEAIPDSSKLKFDCADGLYSVVRGAYRPNDRNFVNWSTDFSDSTFGYAYIFQCNISPDADLPKGYILINEVLVKDGEFGIYNGLVNRLVAFREGRT